MMQPNPNRISRVPEFASIMEAAEFWDTHSTEEFADEFLDDEVVIAATRLRRILEVELDNESADRLMALSKKTGTSAGELVRSWIDEKLEAMCGD